MTNVETQDYVQDPTRKRVRIIRARDIVWVKLPGKNRARASFICVRLDAAGQPEAADVYLDNGGRRTVPVSTISWCAEAPPRDENSPMAPPKRRTKR